MVFPEQGAGLPQKAFKSPPFARQKAFSGCEMRVFPASARPSRVFNLCEDQAGHSMKVAGCNPALFDG